MPKQKTNRAAAKRFSVTGTGKAKRGHANLRHGMIAKNRTGQRRLVGRTGVAPADQARVQRLLGQR
jgi:large subunit ribosomal protein L35